MPYWAGALAVRRWRAQWALFALVLAVAVIAGSVLCGSLLLIRSTEQAGVRSALASMSADRVDVLVRVIRPGSPVSAARSAVDAGTAEAFGTGAQWSGSGWATTEWSSTPEGVYSYLAEFDDASSGAALVEGVWPSDPPGIAVPQSAAESLGLTIGDTLDLGARDAPARLRVDGIYTAAVESGGFWETDPLLGQGSAEEFPKPGTSYSQPVHAVGPLITAPGGIDASAIPPVRLTVVEHPSFRGTDVADLTALRAAVTEADFAIAKAVSHPGGELFVDSGLAGALDDVNAGLHATRSAALIIAFLMVVVVAMAAAAVTRLLVEAHAAESAMLLARGATRGQRWQTIAIDALAIAAVVAVVSPWGGVLLHGLIVATSPLRSADVPQWALPSSAEWLGALAVAVLVGALLCLPSSKSPGVSSSTSPRVLAVAAGTALAVVAALMAWRALTIDAPAGDLLFLLTPAVLVAALAVVGGRLVGASARPVAAVTGRARGAVAPLAGWFAARGADRAAGVVLIALTVAVSLVTLGASATWQQAVQDEAAVALGAPARASVDAGPAVDGRSPVVRRQTLVSKQVPIGTEAESPTSSAQILGLDAGARGLLGGAASEGAVSNAGGAAIFDALPRTDRADTGPALPPGTSGLQARMAVDAPDGIEAAVSAVVEDSSGAVSVLALGTQTTPAAPMTVTSAPDAISSDRDSLRLVALTVKLRGGESAGLAPVTVTLDQIAATASGSEGAVPVEMSSAGEWAAFNNDDPTEPPTAGVTESGIELSVAAHGGPAPVTYGAAGWDPDARIGAVVPATLADELDLHPGAEISAFVAGTPVVFRMVGTAAGVPGAATAADLHSLAAGLPSAWRGGSSIVVDGRALVHRLVQSSAFGPLVDEYWLPGPASAEAIAAAQHPSEGDAREEEPFVEAAALGRTMIESPLRAEIPAAAVVTVWASVLLALAGFGARTASVSRSRRLETAQLRAIGLSRQGMLGLASLDTGAVAVAGIAIGLAAGWATLALVGTRVVRSAGGGPVPLVVPWQAVVLLPLALIAALGVISLAVALAQRRLPLPELLRTGAGE